MNLIIENKRGRRWAVPVWWAAGAAAALFVLGAVAGNF